MQTRPRPKKYIRYNRKARPVVEGPPNLVLRPHQVLVRPLVTEKGTHLSGHHNQYTFMVNLHSTKTDINAAVQELFNAGGGLASQTQIRHGKGPPLSAAGGSTARLEKSRGNAPRRRQNRVLLNHGIKRS